MESISDINPKIKRHEKFLIRIYLHTGYKQ